MYRKLSIKLTSFLLQRKIINADDIEVYEYSIEVLTSDIVYFLIAFLTAIISKTIFESVLFFLGFLSIRKVAGGYHANSYGMCHFLFWLNQVIMILLSKFLVATYERQITFVFLIIGIICVLAFAPVENVNKPFSEQEKKKFAWLSRIIAVLTLFIITVLYFTDISFYYICIYTFGLFSVSISLGAEKIKKLKKRSVHNEEQEECRY